MATFKLTWINWFSLVFIDLWNEFEIKLKTDKHSYENRRTACLPPHFVILIFFSFSSSLRCLFYISFFDYVLLSFARAVYKDTMITSIIFAAIDSSPFQQSKTSNICAAVSASIYEFHRNRKAMVGGSVDAVLCVQFQCSKRSEIPNIFLWFVLLSLFFLLCLYFRFLRFHFQLLK